MNIFEGEDNRYLIYFEDNKRPTLIDMNSKIPLGVEVGASKSVGELIANGYYPIEYECLPNNVKQSITCCLSLKYENTIDCS
jgi:hypothetical protein